MIDEPWLSIVVPAYNAERYLEECISSINPDGHDDVEVVLVDDGSTDSTPQICDMLANKHICIRVIHRENGGLPAARNTGVVTAGNLSKEHWFWFVDSDDVIDPRALDYLYGIKDTLDSQIIRVGLSRFFDGEEPEWQNRPLMNNVVCEEVGSSEFLEGLYKGLYGHYVCSFLIRADTFSELSYSSCMLNAEDDHGPFAEDYSLYEDVVFTQRVVRHVDRICVCGAPLYGYRQVADSMSHKESNKASESGLRAVLSLKQYDRADNLNVSKLCMEISLLFTAYRIAERNKTGDALRMRIKEQIVDRVQVVGFGRLGRERLIRYFLLRTGLMDKIISWRSHG